MWIEADVVFCVRAENDLLPVRGSIDLVLVRVVEIDLALALASKMKFWCGGSKKKLCLRPGR